MRFAGSGRGISIARAAFWRNRRPKSAVSGSSSRIRSSASAPVRPSKRSSGGSSRFGQAEEQAGVDVQAGGGHAEPTAESRQQGDLQPEVQLAAERREHGQARARRPGPGTPRSGSCGRRGWRRPAVAGGRGNARASGRPSGSSRHSRSSHGRSVGVIQPAGDLAAERADRLAQLGRARRRLAMPERHHARLALGPADQHAVRLDGVDPPGRVAQHEGLAHPPLEDEFLVELAEPRAAVAQVDRVLARVGDRPAADQGAGVPCRAGRPGGYGSGPRPPGRGGRGTQGWGTGPRPAGGRSRTPPA